MEKRFIVLTRDSISSNLLDDGIISCLKNQGDFYGPFSADNDRCFTAALTKLDKHYDCYILLDEELFGTDFHENVEFARSFSPTLNHLLYFDISNQMIICEDDVSFSFDDFGLSGAIKHVDEVCAYDG